MSEYISVLTVPAHISDGLDRCSPEAAFMRGFNYGKERERERFAQIVEQMLCDNKWLVRKIVEEIRGK